MACPSQAGAPSAKRTARTPVPAHQHDLAAIDVGHVEVVLLRKRIPGQSAVGQVQAVERIRLDGSNHHASRRRWWPWRQTIDSPVGRLEYIPPTGEHGLPAPGGAGGGRNGSPKAAIAPPYRRQPRCRRRSDKRESRPRTTARLRTFAD